MFKLALVQMEVVGGDKARNLARAEAMIAQAASNGAQCVLLPETMDLGWTHGSAPAEAEPIPGGRPFESLARAAGQNEVYLCAGLVERDGDRIYNAAVLIDPDGNLALKHRKLNELRIGHSLYDQGDRLGVCHTPFGTIGVVICADAFARDRVLTRALGYMGADVILSPSAWAVEADHDNSSSPYGQIWLDSYVPVARDFSMWIASVSNVGWITDGPWKGRKCIGCSLVVDPKGAVALRGPYGVEAETVLYIDIDPRERPARGDGWARHWSECQKSASHRRTGDRKRP